LDETKTPSAKGPSAIIIARSSRQVELLHSDCLKILPKERVDVIKAFGKWNCESKRVSLLNGCDLLITTPPCFERLAEGDLIQIFNKERIKHLVFDDLDKMSVLFDKEIKRIVSTCTMGEKFPERNPQLIVTSTSWKQYLRSYMKLTCEPIVIIGSYVDAALYSKCQFKITKNSFDEKCLRLLSHLRENEWQSRKTLIIMSTQTEINHLKDYFKNNAIPFSVVDNKSSRDDFSELNENWSREVAPLMTLVIATDQALKNCKINCVKTLIHFSLPDNWTKFSLRFSTMFGNFHDFLNGKHQDNSKTMVLLDDENAHEIPRLIDFAKDRNVMKDIPDHINELVKVRNLNIAFESFII
jgi:ATP-dependent RNA helicase TDRD12